MPEPDAQPRSREIEPVDSLGGHGEPMIPESRRGQNMEPPYDPSTPLVSIQRKRTEYTQRLSADRGPHLTRGRLGYGVDGEVEISEPRQTDPAYAPNMPRVSWNYASHGNHLDDLLRSKPVGPENQRAIADLARKEEKHA